MSGLLAVCAAAVLIVTVPAGGCEKAGALARGRHWQLTALRAPEAWKHSRGESALVAVLDTGVDARHPDLLGAVIGGPDLTGVPGPKGRHGTAMASLIAGRGHGGRHGVVGVAPAARVLSVRVTLESDDPRRTRPRTGGRDALAKGIRYAADQGADVISMSLGAGSWKGSAAEAAAVRYAIGKGAVLVASVGNDGDDVETRHFPAAYPGVIAVGAVDRRLNVPRFSSRQDYLSVVAPGTGIVGADGPEAYVIGDGTSSAAAIVAGVAALIRSAHPGLPPSQVRAAIESGTRHRPADGHSRAYGHGVVDAALALREAARLARPAPAAAGPRRSGLRLTVVLGLIGLVVVMSMRVLVKRRRPYQALV
ncbi:S8 family serine peptidase [Nonomuraea longicatena]|uniref:Type VII secretion-associated serine protease mycosin n=1 Tax=Nonomuraea longicatena TaxID=83682 RepID=A0ABP4B5R8_9ACTN